MTRSVEFYFDFGSPAAYLAWTQLPALCADAGAQLLSRPVLLGGVFQATGNRAPITVPLKGQYLFVDLARFARRYGVPLQMNPHFPINTLALMRAAVGLQMRGDDRFDAYCAAIYRAIWVDGLNLGDAAVIGQVLSAAGLDAQGIMALASEPDVKEALKQQTEAAVARGVFGAPTCFVGDEMFWGQDRLDFVREALTTSTPA
jgi:2-hydroxychromene-2-carboxylate isomerase